MASCPSQIHPFATLLRASLITSLVTDHESACASLLRDSRCSTCLPKFDLLCQFQACEHQATAMHPLRCTYVVHLSGHQHSSGHLLMGSCMRDRYNMLSFSYALSNEEVDSLICSSFEARDTCSSRMPTECASSCAADGLHSSLRSSSKPKAVWTCLTVCGSGSWGQEHQ